MATNEVTIRLPNGRAVGKLRGDTFCRNVKPEHMWRKFGSSGYAYNESVISQLLNHGCRYLMVESDEATLTCNIGTFQQHAVPIDVPEEWGSQRVLKIQYWKKQDKEQTEQQMRLLE